MTGGGSTGTAKAAAWLLASCLALVVCIRFPVLARDLEPDSTPPVIKIGLTAPFEGRSRALGYEALYAVKWAVGQRNGSGGLAGYQVELVALNDNDDAGLAATQAAKFAADPMVLGVIGPFSTHVASAAAATYARSGVPQLIPAVCPSVQQGSYCLGPDVGTLSRALIAALPSDGADLLVDSPSAIGEALEVAARRTWAGPWTDETLVAMRSDPVGVYLYDGDMLSAGSLLLRMRDAGIETPMWGGPSLGRRSLFEIAGEAAAGTCHAQVRPSLADLSSDGPFALGYRELTGTDPGPWAALAYEATVVLFDAIERAAEGGTSVTRAEVVAALADAPGPAGDPLFENGQRQGVAVELHCAGLE